MTKICIPSDLQFSSLSLAREVNGDISYEWPVIERVCLFNGIDPEDLAAAGENPISEILTGWYAAHRLAGGALDQIAEDLIAEVKLEDQFGGGLSYQPGTA